MDEAGPQPERPEARPRIELATALPPAPGMAGVAALTFGAAFVGQGSRARAARADASQRRQCGAGAGSGGRAGMPGGMGRPPIGRPPPIMPPCSCIIFSCAMTCG